MIRTTVERYLNHINENLDQLEKRKKMIMDLKSNPLLVFLTDAEVQEVSRLMMDGIYENLSIHRSIQKWCFENRITFMIEKYTIDVIDSHTFERPAFWARRFHTTEDATAFKLRWGSVTEKDIYEEPTGLDDEIPF